MKHPRLRGEDRNRRYRKKKQCWKHPRLRGEDGTSKEDTCLSSETPPLTRGRPPAHDLHDEPLGNTPAYAGKTRSMSHSSLKCWKHPRLRGEDPFQRCKQVTASETPPLTRGRPGGSGVQATCDRNTPAYAGKTLARSWMVAGAQKHPRLRGEDCSNLFTFVLNDETPPLTRGRPEP